MDDNDTLTEIHLSINRYAFAVLFANMAALIFGMPFVLLRHSYYSASVIAFSTYLTLIPVLVAAAAILFLAALSLFKTKLLKEEKRGKLPAKAEKLLMLARVLRNILFGFAVLLALSGITSWEVQGTVGYSYNLSYLSWAAWLLIGTTMLYIYVKNHLQKNIRL